MRTKPKIAIIDYGAGNIASVANALEKCGAKTIIAKTPAAMETSGIQTRKAATQNSDVQAQKGAKTSSAAKFAACLQKADAIVLPGVGSFSCAKNISKIRAPLLAAMEKKPFFGICLGMQLLFSNSEEAKGSGLGIFEGKVRRLKCKKLPNVGWRSISIKGKSLLFAGIKKPVFYFCHSYAIRGSKRTSALSCAGSDKFVCALEKGNTFAVQFHPEKSGPNGLKLLSNFVKIVQGASKCR